MRPYRQIRTITGQKIFVRMTKEDIRERRLYWLEVVLTPILTVYIFALAAGMIKLG